MKLLLEEVGCLVGEGLVGIGLELVGLGLVGLATVGCGAGAFVGIQLGPVGGPGVPVLSSSSPQSARAVAVYQRD